MTEEQKNDPGAASVPPSPSETSSTSAPSHQQPPVGQPVSQPHPPTYQASQPVYAPTPLVQLTGGMKFGWFVVGALLGIGGIVLSWLVNVDKLPQVKSDALKWTIIGFVVWIVLGIILSMVFAGMIAAMIGAAGASSYGYGNYYGSW